MTVVPRRIRVKRALKKLAEGRSSNQIAERLAELGIQGRRYIGNDCPVAVYVLAETGVDVSVTYTRVYGTWFGPAVWLPFNVSWFMRNFDQLDYPDLVKGKRL